VSTPGDSSIDPAPPLRGRLAELGEKWEREPRERRAGAQPGTPTGLRAEPEDDQPRSRT
jgi:hypothetical protein